MRMRRTGRHVKSRATSKVRGDGISGGKSKVGKLDVVAMVGYQNVLGLQVAMVNPNVVAELNGIQNLEKGMLGQLVVADESAVFRDVGKQVTFRAELNHDKGTIRTLQYAEEGDDIAMLARLVVKGNLSSLEAPLPGVQASLGKGLYGIGYVGESVNGLVNHSVSANS